MRSVRSTSLYAGRGAHIDMAVVEVGGFRRDCGEKRFSASFTRGRNPFAMAAPATSYAWQPNFLLAPTSRAVKAVDQRRARDFERPAYRSLAGAAFQGGGDLFELFRIDCNRAPAAPPSLSAHIALGLQRPKKRSSPCGMAVSICSVYPLPA